MIIEGITGLTYWFITVLFDGFNVVTLPVNLVSVLVDFLRYGAWVLGVDLLGVALSSILFWLTTKFGIGLALFIWRLLPLT